jgi:hypothetical protein
VWTCRCTKVDVEVALAIGEAAAAVGAVGMDRPRAFRGPLFLVNDSIE